MSLSVSSANFLIYWYQDQLDMPSSSKVINQNVFFLNSKIFLSYRFRLTFSAKSGPFDLKIIDPSSEGLYSSSSMQKTDLKRFSRRNLRKTILPVPLRIDESTKSNTLSAISLQPGKLSGSGF